MDGMEPLDAIAAQWAASGQTLVFSAADMVWGVDAADAESEAAAVLEAVQAGGWTAELEQAAASLSEEDDEPLDEPVVVNDRAKRAQYDRTAELLYRDLAAGKIGEREAAYLAERL